MPKLTIDELWEKRGNFLNTGTGEVVDEPEGWVPILSGPWPNPNIGARQASCSNCQNFVGVSPRGWEFHLEDPDCRPMFCEFCFRVLMELVRRMNEPKPPSA